MVLLFVLFPFLLYYLRQINYQSSCMAKLLQYMDKMQTDPVITKKLKKVSCNQHQFIQKINQNQSPSKEQEKQYLNSIIKKIIKKQKIKINNQIHVSQRDQIKGIKKNLRKMVKQQNIQNIMGSNDTKTDELNKLLAEHSDRVDINKKYHRQISLKFNIFHEQISIIQQKRIFKQKKNLLQSFQATKNNMIKMQKLMRKPRISQKQFFNWKQLKQMPIYRRSMDQITEQSNQFNTYNRIKRKNKIHQATIKTHHN